MSDKMIKLKYDSDCVGCGKRLKAGDVAMWQPGEGVLCLVCEG